MRKGLAIALTIIMLVSTVVTLSQSASAADTYAFVTEWGSSGLEDGQFYSPQNIAVDPAGNVYVTDLFARVQKFDSAGTFLTMWRTYDLTGYLQYAIGIDIDPSGNVFVVGYQFPDIHKFDSAGNLLAHWRTTEVWGGADLELDSLGNIYVADVGQRIIAKYNSAGNFVQYIGTPSGTGDGQFMSLGGIAIDSQNNIYAVDSGNNRVQKFSADGTYLTKWDSSGLFNYPRGIAIDGNGKIYVSDDNNRVQIFDSNGNILTSFGSAGTGDGQFAQPGDIAVDASGAVYVMDLGNSRVEKFAPSLPADTIKPIVVYAKESVKRSTSSISASYSDSGSGIDVSSVQIFVNGVDVTSSATITASGFHYPTSMLTKGGNMIEVHVKDVAGNEAIASWIVRLVGPGLK